MRALLRRVPFREQAYAGALRWEEGRLEGWLGRAASHLRDTSSMLAATYFTGSARSSLGSTEALFQLFLLLPMQVGHLGNLLLRAGENPAVAELLSVLQASRLPSGCPPDLLFSFHVPGCFLSWT